MNPSPHPYPAITDPDHVRRILKRHRPFLWAAPLALSLLYIEEAWALATFYPHAVSGSEILSGILIGLIAFAGNAMALLLPSEVVQPANFPRPVGAFAQAFSIGMGISMLTSALGGILLFVLLGVSIDAAYVLLKDVYFYTLMAALIHGLLYYVRHMHWLYDRFGAADSPLKPIAASGGLGAVIFIVTVVFPPLDLKGIETATGAVQGLYALHIYGRDLYLLTLAAGLYVWHLRWIADH